MATAHEGTTHEEPSHRAAALVRLSNSLRAVERIDMDTVQGIDPDRNERFQELVPEGSSRRHGEWSMWG